MLAAGAAVLPLVLTVLHVPYLLALTVLQRSVERFKLFPLRSEAVMPFNPNRLGGQQMPSPIPCKMTNPPRLLMA